MQNHAPNRRPCGLRLTQTPCMRDDAPDEALPESPELTMIDEQTVHESDAALDRESEALETKLREAEQ